MTEVEERKIILLEKKHHYEGIINDLRTMSDLATSVHKGTTRAEAISKAIKKQCYGAVIQGACKLLRECTNEIDEISK